MGKVLVFGASENPARYSNIAIHALQKNWHDVVAIGSRIGEVNGLNILTGTPELEEIDTITLYVNPILQQTFYDYFINLKPRRIIFNPGTENHELASLCEQNGIRVVEACTLVLLATGRF
jgi:uncharacterized protein